MKREMAHGKGIILLFCVFSLLSKVSSVEKSKRDHAMYDDGKEKSENETSMAEKRNLGSINSALFPAKRVNISTKDSEVLMGQVAPQNIAEERENRSYTTAAIETKTGDATTSLIICLSVYSVVFALYIVIVYKCRGEQKKPTRRKVTF